MEEGFDKSPPRPRSEFRYYSHRETCDIAGFVRRWQMRNLLRHVAMRLRSQVHW